MNILFVVGSWPNFYTTYLFHEVAWLASKGHYVNVVSLKQEEFANAADPSIFGVEHIPVVQLREANAAPIIELVRRNQIQVAYAYGARGPAELALHLHHEIGLPYSLRLLGGEVHSHPSPSLGEMTQFASALCPMSQFLADVLLRQRPIEELPPGLPEKVDPSKVHVCPNGVPSHILADRPARQSDEKIAIGTIGRLSPAKRQRDLLEAVADLVPDFPGLSLHVIGGGEMEDDLHRHARDLGIAGRTTITGATSWPETLRLAAELSIYVQTSEKEGFCSATIDAASQGLPLILSRTGGHEECVIPGSNGYLFDAGDLPTLRRHLHTLLSAGSRARTAMGAASLNVVRDKFLLDITMRKIENVLLRTLEARPSQAVNSL
ncbi:MAG TPA: glycosyltransferase family 4 protein [Candidatus Angelobacter sp.]|nr:glycosyltransferase family 4 protein [Candidatus Angelobacter sp.]